MAPKRRAQEQEQDKEQEQRSHAPPPEGEEFRYAEKGYWDGRYEVGGDEVAFEWFMSYEELRPLLRVSRRSSVLDVGCGTSRLLADMREDGYTGRLLGVDFSPKAIQAQKTSLGAVESSIELLCADVRRLESLADGSFDCVIDKGTVDAMISARGAGTELVGEACAELGRVLGVGGRLCVCSHHLYEEDEDDEWLSAVTSGLLAPQTAAWTLEIHLQGQERPSVYLFTKHRLSARRSHAAAELEMTVHDHSED